MDAAATADEAISSTAFTSPLKHAAAVLLLAVQKRHGHARQGLPPLRSSLIFGTESSRSPFPRPRSAMRGGPRFRSSLQPRRTRPTPSNAAPTTGSQSALLPVRPHLYPIASLKETHPALIRRAGSLVVLPFDHQGKQGSKAPTIQTGVQNITAFDVDSFDDLVAVGGEHGQVGRTGVLAQRDARS